MPVKQTTYQATSRFRTT